MKLIWTKHAQRQLENRTSLYGDDVLLYFVVGAAVLVREEDNGTREYVIFSPKDKESFAVILARDGQVITIMPLKWRPVAPSAIDQARRLWKEKIEEAA